MLSIIISFVFSIISFYVIGIDIYHCKAINETISIDNDFKNWYINFSLKLFNELNDNSSENILISPLSIIIAIMLAGNGANNNTLKQIEYLFDENISINEMNYQLCSYIDLISKDDFNITNSIWISNNNFMLNPTYINNVNSLYDANVYLTDFSKREAVDKINKWCDESTNGMIKKVLDYDTVNENTLATIINAICLDFKWREPYLEYMCKEEMFFGEKGDIKVNMMSSIESKIIDNGSEIGFVKDYENDRFSFVCFMPNENKTINNYFNTFDYIKYNSIFENIKNEEVLTYIPKFKVDYKKSLNKALFDLGVKDAFMPNFANFTKMGISKNNIQNLYISDVIHNAFIDNNLCGTKASAVTSIVMNKCSLVSTNNLKKVILNKPFIYIIIDNKTNIPIFMGNIKNMF